MLIEKDPIYIFSNYAVYNTENSDTKFFSWLNKGQLVKYYLKK